ncbi:MAG: hypothetical protein SNJ77_06755, partial [Cytophagales bacterium]
MPKLFYQISVENRVQQLIKITVQFQNSNLEKLDLVLSQWRPGRYERQNYIKNILNFSVISPTTFDYKLNSTTWSLNSE